MFVLINEIKAWKKILRKNRSLEEGYIEELESHLNDLIDNKIEEGKTEEEAFRYAVEKIGKINEIGEEYFKSDTTNKISGKPSWKSPNWMPDLIWNYFKVAVRNIKKNKGISLTNVFGLSIGIASVLLISMLVIYEMSFDGFNVNKDRIYRVYTEVARPDGLFTMAPVMFPFAPAAEESVPEIENAVRLCESSGLLTYEDKKFYSDITYADEKTFDVFTFPLKYGDKENVLVETNTIVLSERTAEQYFGKENPIGKTMIFQNKDNLKVTGVFYDLPANSSIKADIFVSIKTLARPDFERLTNWSSFSNEYTFLLLRDNVSPKAVEAKLEKVVEQNVDKDLLGRYKMKLQKLDEIHFSDFEYDFAETTPVLYLYIFSAVASFILLIACINFINLTTARSVKRGKEVGIRKVNGASRFQLIKQFLSESFIITIISLAAAIIIIFYTIPEVNKLLKSNLSFGLIVNVNFVLILCGLVLLTALSAGLYPALVLSNAKPVLIMKNVNQRNNNGYYLRAVLIVFQFALSVFLIISTITIYKQAEFLTKHNPGFKSEQILVVPIYDSSLMENPEPLKNMLAGSNYLLSSSYSSGTPACGSTRSSNFIPEGKTEDEELQMQFLEIDYDFINTYEIKILEGRNFSKEFSTDEDEAYLINETAAERLGWESPIGKKIALGGIEEHTIVGVIKDFNYSSLREKIAPAVFGLQTKGSKFLSIKINKTNTEEALEFVKNCVSGLSPKYPFEYYFMNERFEKYYKAEKTIGKLLSVFTGLAVIISCIGILGLVSFVAEQKSKEIGIRKVLGASVSSILILIGRQFLKWVLFANIIIWPAAYFFLDSWLNNFAYRIDIGYLVFAVTLIFSITVTLLTVSVHAGKAALANPVKSLKYE